MFVFEDADTFIYTVTAFCGSKPARLLVAA
jgi:hypothetical protein